jgi:hypothetical protein
MVASVSRLAKSTAAAGVKRHPSKPRSDYGGACNLHSGGSVGAPKRWRRCLRCLSSAPAVAVGPEATTGPLVLRTKGIAVDIFLRIGVVVGAKAAAAAAALVQVQAQELLEPFSDTCQFASVSILY